MVFLFMLVNYADKAVVGLASVPIMHELGLSNAQFGELGSAFFLLFSVSGIAVGFLANRARTRLLMAGMAFVWAAALLPLIGSSSFALLVGSRILLGAAEGPAFPVALHTVYKWFPDSLRALPTSVVASGAAFGSGIVAPFIAWVILHAGWHAAFGMLGATSLVWAAVWLLVAAEGPMDIPRSNGRAAPDHISYAQLLSSRTATGVFLAGFAAYWVIALNIVWLANYLINALHIAPLSAAWIVALPAGMQIALAPALAALSQWLGRRGFPSRLSRGWLGSSCVVLSGVSLMVMTLMPVGPAKIIVIGLGFSIGSVIFTLGSALIGEISPASQRGAMLGITNSVQTLAGLCAPVVMGFVVDVGANRADRFDTGFLYAGALVATLGLCAALLIHPQADRHRFNANELSASGIRR
ncbi:MAG: MFS transporter [Steroidobacteraceae bacterium]